MGICSLEFIAGTINILTYDQIACGLGPDCKVCYARRRSSPRTFGCVREKGYILSAQYFAKNSICRVEKHSKCKILKTIRY